MTKVGKEFRKTGIDIIGDVSWGTHLCQFYQTKEDLIDILVPYFRAGLENNEYCMWVTSEPLNEEEAKEAMRKEVPDFDRYQEKGQIDIVPHSERYLKGGSFNLRRVLNAWIDRLNQALAKGYDGIRVTGNTAWLEKREWAKFADYEKEVNNVIGKYRMIAICTYSIGKCGPSEVIDVVNNHQFALIRREGKWELIESAECKRAEEALLEANMRLQVLQQVTTAVHSTLDLEKVFKQITDGAVYSMGYTTALILTLNDEKKHFEITSLSTKKQLLPQIRKILGFSLKKLSFPADPELNVVIGSVMKGRVAVTKTLAEVAYPVISKRRCLALQKLAGTKNYIVVPLKSEEEVVGAVFITSPREEVSEEDLMFLQNFAHIASQAIRNANLHTQTKQAEEALRKSEERYRLLFERSSDAIFLVDAHTGRYLDANAAAECLTGRSVSELRTLTTHDVTPVGAANRLREAATMQDTLDFGEVTYVQPDGTTRTALLCAVRLSEQMIYGIARDITEHKRAEEREKRMQQELNLASRLAAIGEMASGIAHEINNPLTGVIGFSELLMKRDIPDDIKKELEVINSQAQRVAKIVAGLLAFARQHEPGREYVDINDIISGVLELRSYEMKVNDIKVVPQFDPDLPQTMADGSQLQQVFLNIILNAEKEMIMAHGRGKLLVKTEKVGNNIRISFTDDGPGISKENLDKIFNPFFTTREVGQGTGLGLSICHGIVAQHKGRIYAESELGKGATFVVELPIVAHTERLEKAEAIQEDTWKGSGAKILVVDDETTILEFLKRVLTEQGYKVVTTDRASAAMQRLQSEKYDLILLDIKLPMMGGIELYRHIEAIDPALAQRVMFITGDVLETNTGDFLEKTKTHSLAKPFNIEQLRNEINQILNQ